MVRTMIFVLSRLYTTIIIVIVVLLVLVFFLFFLQDIRTFDATRSYG